MRSIVPPRSSAVRCKGQGRAFGSGPFPDMEQVFCVARTAFVNKRIGTVSRKQRIPLPVSVAHELEAMGLVSIEKQLPALLKPAVSDPQDAGQAAPSSVLRAGQVLATTNSGKRKRGRPKKAGA